MCDMAFLKVLSYSIIFIVAAAPFIDAFYGPHYNIHFVLYVNASIFHGEYNASIYIFYETQHIYFFTENLFIIKAIATNNTQIPKGNEKEVFTHRPKKYIYDTEKHVTVISFPYSLSSGNYTLNMKFSGRLTEDGGFRIYKNKQNEKMWLAATHYHTFATRRLFPLLRDDWYASYHISIKHHKDYTALSNMPVQEINIAENNMQWTRFKPTPMMTVSYITASVVHLAVIPGSQITKLWCRTDIIPYMQFATKVATNIAQYLDEIFLYVRISPETNHVMIPKFHYLLTKENIKFGFVLYGEEDIIFDKNINSVIRRIDITRVIGYKVIHEWLYNAINPFGWDPWLRKGFATFFGIYAADKKFPTLRMQDFFVVQVQHEFLHWSTKDMWPLAFGLGDNSIQIPDYIKASIMFRTFYIIFTEEMFLSGMTWFLRVHYISTIMNFWEVMQATMDKSDLEIKYNVTDRIVSWTQQYHYPAINLERNYNINWLDISVENLNYFVTWIFVNITTQTYPYSKKLPEVWLSSQSMSYKLNIDFVGENDWILVNSQQSGCFRVNYDAENWNRLSKYLNSKSFKKIHVLDRAKLVDDSFHFLMSGRLNYTVFLNISHYLSQDTDYISWYPMFKNLEYMSGFFAFPESAFIKEEIIQLMKMILSDLEYPTFYQDQKSYGNTFISCLRQEAAKWLCVMNYNSCLTISNAELQSYLSYRNTSSSHEIWSGWKEWTFCNGLKENNYTWKEVFHMYWTKSDESVLKSLACSTKPDLIKNYMYFIKFGVVTNKIKNLHHIESFCYIIARHAKNELMLDMILNNLENTKPGEISITTALTIIINHIYSKKQIDKVNKYLDKYKEDIAMDDFKLKLDLRWFEIRIQLFTFRYLAKSLDDILIEEWMYHLW